MTRKEKTGVKKLWLKFLLAIYVILDWLRGKVLSAIIRTAASKPSR